MLQQSDHHSKKQQAQQNMNKLRLPETVQAAMRSKNPEIDPVAAQYIPQAAEENIQPFETSDPIGDHAHSPVKGIIHRYTDRALLKLSHVCPVYCRYCFRKDMIGPQHNEYAMSKSDLQSALDYIENTKSLHEIILTGGDPLMLSADKIGNILGALDGMDHIKIIRFHTRTPVADTNKISEKLLQHFSNTHKPIYIVLHINHAQELTADVKLAISKLRKFGCILLVQSVLLKGINDNIETLTDLYQNMLALGIKPYMLHHPDMAKGTQHFRIPITKGLKLMQQLRGKISGLAQPDYIIDIPGGYGKVPLTESFIKPMNNQGLYEITDPNGHKHLYQDMAS